MRYCTLKDIEVPKGWKWASSKKWACAGGARAGEPRKCPMLVRMSYTQKLKDGSKRERRYCFSHFMRRTGQWLIDG